MPLYKHFDRRSKNFVAQRNNTRYCTSARSSRSFFTMALLLRKKRPRLVVLAPLLLVSASILCALSIFKSVQLLEGHNPVAEALYLYRRTQSKHKDAQRIVERALVIDGDLLQDPPSWPVEEALENPPMPDGNSTFSACLLL